MTAATMKIDRSGLAIRAALAEFAPSECRVFEAELRQAIGRAAETFDLAPAEAVLDRWLGGGSDSGEPALGAGAGAGRPGQGG